MASNNKLIGGINTTAQSFFETGTTSQLPFLTVILLTEILHRLAADNMGLHSSRILSLCISFMHLYTMMGKT